MDTKLLSHKIKKTRNEVKRYYNLELIQQHLQSSYLSNLLHKLQNQPSFDEYQEIVSLLLKWIYQSSSYLKSVNPHHNKNQQLLTQFKQRVISNHLKASQQYSQSQSSKALYNSQKTQKKLSSPSFNHRPLSQTVSNFLY